MSFQLLVAGTLPIPLLSVGHAVLKLVNGYLDIADGPPSTLSLSWFLGVSLFITFSTLIGTLWGQGLRLFFYLFYMSGLLLSSKYLIHLFLRHSDWRSRHSYGMVIAEADLGLGRNSHFEDQRFWLHNLELSSVIRLELALLQRLTIQFVADLGQHLINDEFLAIDAFDHLIGSSSGAKTRQRTKPRTGWIC